MKIITHSMIKNSITTQDAFNWVKHVFMNKAEYQLPPKISIKYAESAFLNTMPCLLSENSGYAGVKVVSRHIERKPILSSTILLLDSYTGETIAIMEGDFITVMRTGAVAALAAEQLAVKGYNRIGFFGLGNTAYATFDVLRTYKQNETLEIFLLRYKNQAEQFISRFDNIKNIKFHVLDSYEAIIKSSQVLFSCVSNMDGIFCEAEKYPAGILVVPIHTKGFQNCDLVFDKIFSDDTGHVKEFKNFSEFSKHNYAELTDVLTGKVIGRSSDKERILSYNIGIAANDIYFAKNIYERLKDSCDEIDLQSPQEKIFY